MRVALERHELRHAHDAVVADAAEVVAAEVDEHDVLGAFLLVALQLLAEAHVLLVVAPRGRVPAIGCVSACRPSTRTSISGDEPTIDTLAHADEVHVRRRIHVAQRAIDGERVGVDVGLEALRQHDLVDVARGDVLLGRAHVAPRSPRGVRFDADVRGRSAAGSRLRERRARVRARGTRSSRTRTGRAPRRSSPAAIARWRSAGSGA